MQANLGGHLTDMLVTMTDRGPDSAGIAVYRPPDEGVTKITLQSDNPLKAFAGLDKKLRQALDNTAQSNAEKGPAIKIACKDTHAVLSVPDALTDKTRAALAEIDASIRVMSVGERIEIYKEVGLSEQVAARFDVPAMRGSHGVGHTRMATESAVTTLGAHPFSTGADQCLVHNGSLSNHNSLRRKLIREGVNFETENDTEVAAAYLSHKMNTGVDLGSALEACLEDLDGFYTFVVGTKEGFGVLRDPIACKPAVLAETDQYVAFGSEYRALVSLPNIEKARVWEPEPATVYFWEQ